MSDPFSNWANKGIERIKEIGHKAQAQFHLTPEDHHAQQQHHEQQMKVDRVELSEEGKIPRARITNNHLDFSASFGNGDAQHERSGKGKGHGGDSANRGDSKHGKDGGASKQHSDKHTEMKRDGNAGAEAGHKAPSQHADHQSAAIKHSGNAGAEAGHKAPSQHADHQSAIKHSGNAGAEAGHKAPSQHADHPSAAIKSSGNAGAEAGHKAPSQHAQESVLNRAMTEGEKYLERVRNAMIAQNHADNNPAHAKNFNEHLKNGGSKTAGEFSQKESYVELRNVPDHVKSGGSKPAELSTKSSGGRKQGSADGHKNESTDGSKQGSTDGHKTGSSNGHKEGGSEGKKVAERNTTKTNSEAPHAPAEEPVSTKAPNSEIKGIRAFGGSLINGTFSALGMVGGYYEMKEGVQQFKNGQHLEGVLNTTAGASDFTCGATSMLYTFGKNSLGSFAAKAGGVGSILSGVGESIEGIKHKDQEKQVEGGLKVTLGVGMLAGGTTAALSTAGLTGWGIGRFTATHVGWGGENLDTKVERKVGNWLNKEINDEYRTTQENERQGFSNAQELMGRSADELNSRGVSRKEMTEAVIGLRAEIASESSAGHDTRNLQAYLHQMRTVRNQLIK